MSLSEAHKNTLSLKYGLPQEHIQAWETQELLRSLSPGEVREYLGREDIDSSGLLFRYPGIGAATIRLDSPPIKNGKPQKYLRRAGEPNSLFNPGVDLAQAQEIWITEGEAKALCGFVQGLTIVGLSGVYNWRTQGEVAELLAEGETLKDEEALLPELSQVNWSGKKVNLLYDSDITPGHRAYPAYGRLAEQLYRLGAEEVRILSLPSLSKDKKTGLDEFIIAHKEQSIQDLQKIAKRKEPYLPIKAGALTYAKRLIRSDDLEDKLNATVAYLGAKGKLFTQDWLKEQGIKGETRSALFQEAKEKLSQLQIKPKSSSSQGTLPELGPEYEIPKKLLQGSPYIIDGAGRLCKPFQQMIRHPDGSEELKIINIPLCNFAAWPLREILKDNGASSERFVEIKGLLQGGASLKPLTVAMKDFEELKWILPGWGIRASVEPYQKGLPTKEHLRHALQLMAQGGIPETTVYTHLGWTKVNGEWVYLHTGGAVGSEAVEVEINPRLGRYTLPSKAGDLKEAVKASLSLLDLGPKWITYPSLALVYLAPLLEPLRQAGVEPGFLLYLWGVTGSLKSTWLALLLSHYGTFDNKSLPASFRDTANSIEGLAFLAKDILLPVDDLYPSSDPRERQRQNGILDNLSRNQGDRRGRGRMKADTSLRESLPPRGLALCSGEVMTLSGSSQPRGLILKLQRGDIDLEKLSQAQAQKGFLSQAMRGYLEYLAPQLDELPPHFSEDFQRLRSKAQKDSKVRSRHWRLNEIAAHLYLGLNLFFRFAIAVGAISQKEAESKLLEAWKIFNEVVDDQAKLAAGEEPVRRFFEAIKELMTLGRIYLATMKDETPELVNITEGAVKIGWGPDEAGIYYILCGPAWEAVTKYLRVQEDSLPLSKTAFLDALEQKELLALKQGKRRVINKTIAGKDIRVLPLSEKAFNLEVENDVL